MSKCTKNAPTGFIMVQTLKVATSITKIIFTIIISISYCNNGVTYKNPQDLHQFLYRPILHVLSTPRLFLVRIGHQICAHNSQTTKNYNYQSCCYYHHRLVLDCKCKWNSTQIRRMIQLYLCH